MVGSKQNFQYLLQSMAHDRWSTIFECYKEEETVKNNLLKFLKTISLVGNFISHLKRVPMNRLLPKGKKKFPK